MHPWPVRPAVRPLWAAAILAAGCASAPEPAPPDPADIDPSPFWRAQWAGDTEAAEQAADAFGWGARRSVEGERLRQMLEVTQGRRPELVAEVQTWEEGDPANPSLQYLEARLFQQPQRQLARFEELASDHPEHAWIQLGAAGVSQSQGKWSRAEEHLADAPDWSDARDFRRLVEARQLAHGGDVDEALSALEENAIAKGYRDALAEYVVLAADNLRPEAAERGRAHAAILALASSAPPRLRMDAVARRAVAEIRYQPDIELDDLLAGMDEWSRLANLPTNWAVHPRYELPLVGALVRPESGSGALPAWWREYGGMLLVGQTIVRGTELAYLQGTRHAFLDWPGEDQRLEIVLADTALTTHSNAIVGGAIFRGFYVRRDLTATVARALEETTPNASVLEEFVLPKAPGFPEYLPEDWDLPARLRARMLATGRSAYELELRHVALHEAGHLPEVLDTIPGGPSVGLALSLFWEALWQGDPMALLEQRAEARALAVSPEPHWALADVVERARSEPGTYQRAYAQLLRKLLAAAEARELPPLPLWHELEPATLRELARTVCEQEGWELLPAHKVPEILDLIAELDAREDAAGG